MRLILAAFFIVTLLAVVQAGQIASFISSLLADQPGEIRSQLSTAFENLATITATDSSVFSSISSEVNEAINSAASDLSSISSSIEISVSSISSVINAASTTTSSFSAFAVTAAFILSIIFFQAF